MFSQSLAQHLQRPEQMGFDAALGTAHGVSRLRHIHLFPDAEKKRLLLTKRQGAKGYFQFSTGPLTLHLAIRRGSG